MRIFDCVTKASSPQYNQLYVIEKMIGYACKSFGMDWAGELSTLLAFNCQNSIVECLVLCATNGNRDRCIVTQWFPQFIPIPDKLLSGERWPVASIRSDWNKELLQSAPMAAQERRPAQRGRFERIPPAVALCPVRSGAWPIHFTSSPCQSLSKAGGPAACLCFMRAATAKARARLRVNFSEKSPPDLICSNSPWRQ